jgi:teichuronic acid biosynthesis glycosyltransferase TuaH
MRILYLMQVDWRWIKQRPHILAEGLMQQHEVLVVYRPWLNRHQFPENPSPIKRIPLIPCLDRPGAWLRGLDAWLNRLRITQVLAEFKPDLIWLCAPQLISYLPESASKIPLVYDCMDLASGFFDSQADKTAIDRLENQALERAKLVFCSSQFLLQTMQKRVPQAPVTLLRNGFLQHWLELPRQTKATSTEFHLAYIGTIAAWFDWDAVLFLLENIPRLQIHLIGPQDGVGKKHQRLHLRGVVAHHQLPEVAQEFDGFIMPFVVNPLVEGVDPVKLYEYLLFGKEIFSVYYSEIERFSPFIHFYQNHTQLLDLVQGTIDKTLAAKNTIQSTRSFLEQNTWEEKIIFVKNSLNNLLK